MMSFLEAAQGLWKQFERYGITWDSHPPEIETHNGITMVHRGNVDGWVDWMLWEDEGIHYSLDVVGLDGVVFQFYGNEQYWRLYNNQNHAALMSNPATSRISQRHVSKLKKQLNWYADATGFPVPDVDAYLTEQAIDVFLLPLGRKEYDLYWYHDHGGYHEAPINGLHYMGDDETEGFIVIWNEQSIFQYVDTMEDAIAVVQELARVHGTIPN